MPEYEGLVYTIEFNLTITFCGFSISILLIEKEKLERLSILPKVI